jgi:hypothetical protein
MESSGPPRVDKLAGLLGNAQAAAAAASGLQSSIEAPTPTPATTSQITQPAEPVEAPAPVPVEIPETASPYGVGDADTLAAPVQKAAGLLKFNGLRQSAAGEGGFTPKERPWSLQGEDAWPDKSHYWGRAKDSVLPPRGVTKTKIAFPPARQASSVQRACEVVPSTPGETRPGRSHQGGISRKDRTTTLEAGP